MKTIPLACALGALLLATSAGHAQDPGKTPKPAEKAGAMHEAAGSASVGDIAVEGAYARPSLGKAPNSAAYMILRTSGASDRLVAAASPAAEAVEIHTSEMDSRGVMTMRPVEGVPVEPGAATELKPGGYHVMLVRLVGPLEEGGTIPLTLTFENAGEVTFEVPVGKPVAGADHGGMHKR